MNENSWIPSSRAVDMSTIQHELSQAAMAVIHFWATWNNVDKLMDASLKKLQAKFGDRVEFMSLDTDREETAQFCKHCRVLNLPALAFFRGETHIETLIGLRPDEILAAEFERLITKATNTLGEP